MDNEHDKILLGDVRYFFSSFSSEEEGLCLTTSSLIVPVGSHVLQRVVLVMTFDYAEFLVVYKFTSYGNYYDAVR